MLHLEFVWRNLLARVMQDIEAYGSRLRKKLESEKKSDRKVLILVISLAQ